MSLTIDLNCDLGEGYGRYALGDDLALLDIVTSANIACGFHAGDPATMQRTVEAALARGVKLGAHPSLPDLQGFGRREMQVTAAEVYALTLYQVGALDAFARAHGAGLSHVKPHGALYNMAARDELLADAIARALCDFDPRLVLYALAGSRLAEAGASIGIAVAHEVFADRTYQADGSLTPRQRADALIRDRSLAVEQVLSIVRDGQVLATDGTVVALRADTICLHGDATHAVEFARHIRRALEAEGIVIQARPAGDQP